MADIFGRNISKNGAVFVSEEALMTLSNAGELGVGALVQNVEIQYQQTFNMLFELGSNNIYPIMGRPQGSLTIGRIVGEGGFSESFFDTCGGGSTISIHAKQGTCGPGPGGGGTVGVTMHSVFVTNYGVTMNTGDLMVKENVQATFLALTKDG